VATATANAADTTDLVLLLATEGEVRLADVAGRVEEAALALARVRGELVVEGGTEWTGPKQRWHAPYHKLRAETLPAAPKYQKYQLEVCVNKEKDVWEWLPEGEPADGRDTRYARRDINRAEAESLFGLSVRLTEKAAASLTN
jgi:hypothetical protein